MDTLAQLRPLIPYHTRVMVMDPVESLDEVKAFAGLRVDAMMVNEVLLNDGDKIQRLQNMLSSARSNGENA